MHNASSFRHNSIKRYTVLFFLPYNFQLRKEKHGEQSLQFKRLARSFPFGDPEDELPKNLRQQVETIFHEFNANEHDWQKRLELRRELAVLVEKNPELMEIFPREISDIHPRLAAQGDHS